MYLGATGAVDVSYGIFDRAEIALAGTYLGQAYGGSGRARFEWLDAAGGGKFTSVASIGGFAAQYVDTSSTYYPTTYSYPTFYYVNNVSATAYGGSVASSTGYKVTDGFELYAGPKIYFMQLNGTYGGNPAVSQSFSSSNGAYQGFIGAALTLALGSRLDGVIDLMGTATMQPANVRDGNLVFVPGVALTLLLQTHGEDRRASAPATRPPAPPAKAPARAAAPAAPVGASGPSAKAAPGANAAGSPGSRGGSVQAKQAPAKKKSAQPKTADPRTPQSEEEE
jgi:hypothetical protein